MKSYKHMILAYTKSDDVLHLLTQIDNSMYKLPQDNSQHLHIEII